MTHKEIEIFAAALLDEVRDRPISKLSFGEDDFHAASARSGIAIASSIANWNNVYAATFRRMQKAMPPFRYYPERLGEIMNNATRTIHGMQQ